MAMTLKLDSVSFGYRNHPVLHNVSIDEAKPGEVTAVIGPNAAGKSTLLKCIAGLLDCDGTVLLDDKPLSEYSQDERTEHICYLPQEVAVNAILTVFEAVLLAKKHSASWSVSDDDLAAVSKVLDELDISELGSRFLNELSGGQKQMVSIAQAIVRNPKVLLLDEPTSSLDLQHQLEVFELVEKVAIEQNMITLVAVHDLNLAARFAETFIVMQDGRKLHAGSASQVLTPEVIEDVYKVIVDVDYDSDGRPLVYLKRSAKSAKTIDNARRLVSAQ